MKEEKNKPKETPATTAVKEVTQSSKRRKKKAPYVYTVVLLVAIVFGGFYFVKYQQLDEKYQNLTMTEEERAKKTVSEVATLYKIPSYDEEKPTQVGVFKDQATVDDFKKRSEFFKDAVVDDILLAYQNADIVVLYRPSEKKIIVSDQYSKILAGTVNIAVIAPANRTQEVEQQIKQKIKNAVITEKAIPKTEITTGIVVDVTGKEPDAAKKTAELLGYSVGSLPQGETAPQGATFVVLVPSSSTP